MASRLAVKDVEETVTAVKDYIIHTKFANMINKQICQCVVYEIKYQLSCIDISNKNDAEAKLSLQDGLNGIDYEAIKRQKEAEFLNALNSCDYSEVLKAFNEKGIVAEIGSILGVDKREYQKKVINLLYGDYRNEIAKALEGYLPSEIPR